MKTYNITLLPGDGVGREVTEAARRVLSATDELFEYDIRFTEKPIGGAAIDATGDPLPSDTLESCIASDAVFLGAVGGPKWDGGTRRPEEGLLGLRKNMGLFANLRPVKVTAATIAHSPLKAEIVRDVDMLIVRELTGGAYFGAKTRDATSASDLCIYTVEEIERVARVAFRAAMRRRNHVTLVDKANVLETSRLWRDTVTRIQKAEFPRVALEYVLVDTAAMRLIQKPRAFDVVLTENMFGDILSDEASMLPGSIGLLGSASLGAGGPGLFEPIHGSAPDIAGKDLCNPTGAILSAAMLLRYGLGRTDEADAVEAAVAAVLASGRSTTDLGGTESCSSFARAVVDALRHTYGMSANRTHWGMSTA
ncbi:MAG TPA: 3-isopropylmalate dehydrogenase [Rhizomicrobium sp.]|jgi:3-isopropylmalate dehydrogenase|nr:3-isopropylmalate dehydrogenase [Rhizomicrobium sp.]